MHQSALCTLWSTMRSTDCKSFVLDWVRSTALVYQQKALLSGWEKWSTDRSTAIPNGRKSDHWRSTDRRISFRYFSNGYILFCFFLGLFPTTLLGFLLMFLSLINSGNVEKPTRFKKLEKDFTSLQEDLVKF